MKSLLFKAILPLACLLALCQGVNAQVGLPVQIVNAPDLPVPVISTDRLPIPPNLADFQRQYCSRWNGPRLVSENEERRLVEYRAQLPTIQFPNRVYWSGLLLGSLVGTEQHLSIGWQGAVDVTTACLTPVPPGFVPAFIPDLNPRTLNRYQVSHEVSGFACAFDQGFPVDVLVRARILEFKGVQNDLAVVRPEGSGRICLTLTTIGGAPEG